MNRVSEIISLESLSKPRIDTTDIRIFVRDFYSHPGFDVKNVRWESVLSPIERDLWRIFQQLGFPVYPQYPLDGFIIDFAWEPKKIAFEADGEEWHKNKDRDKTRDLCLEALGWKTYRMTGADILSGGAYRYLKDTFCELTDEEYYKKYY